MNIKDIINNDELERLSEDLKGWTEYVPLKFISLTDEDYFQKCTKEALRKYKQKRQGLTGQQYLIDDILEWVKEYPQFEYILKKE